MPNYFLILDAGTGSIRAVIFDEKGNQISVVQKEWYHLEDKRYPGSMDFDYKNNWILVQECITNVVQNSSIHPKDIIAISATSMREGFVLYDKNGQEVWACSNVDSRADEEATFLKSIELENDIYEISGQTFALSAIPRLLWLKNNEPSIYQNVSAITMINDWILYKLSGVLAADPSNSCTTGIFDLTKRTWSKEILNTCNLNDEILTPIYEAGTIIGNVLKKVSINTGLSQTTKVVTGGGDAQMATVGAGAIENGQVVISGGSFWQQEVNFDKPIIDKSARVRTNCHAVSNLWQIETISFYPGIVTRWFRDVFCNEEKDIASKLNLDFYTLMEAQAENVPIGSNGIIPIFSDKMNFINWKHAAPSFLNLSIDVSKSGKHVLFRSLLENAAMVSYGNLKIIEEITGFYPDEVIFVGGASKGKLWGEILADMLNVTVKIPVVKESAALGTALCSAVGMKIYPDLQAAVHECVKIQKEYKPNVINHQLYLDFYYKWERSYKELLNLADRHITTHMWKAPGLSI